MVEQKCSLNELFIEQYADNELDFRESSEVSVHLGNCEACRKKYEEILFTKNLISAFNSKEKLSLLEKEGFMSLIDQNSRKPSLASVVGCFIKSHGFSVAASSFSFASLIFAFVFFLFQTEKENQLVIKEILAAHNNTFPDEFSGNEIAENELNKNFKLDKKTMKSLSSISPVLRGRFTSIAATPGAKIKLAGIDKNQKGTLFLSKKNDHIKNIFENSDCLVKDGEKDCKAKLRHEDGKDMIYWESLDNHFVFVTENNKMAAQMARLIADD